MRPTPDTLKRQLRWLNEIDKALQDRPWNAALRREIQKTLEDNVLLPDDFDQMTEDAIREYLSASTTRILDELEDAPVE